MLKTRRGASCGQGHNKMRSALTCSQQLGNLALHEAELADKDVQNPAQLQAVGVGCGPVCMACKHDFHHTVQQLDAGALGGYGRIGVLQIPAQPKSAIQKNPRP